MNKEQELCEECKSPITEEESRYGWPIPVTFHSDSYPSYICPDCYGDDAYCLEGHLLPSGSEVCIYNEEGCV